MCGEKELMAQVRSFIRKSFLKVVSRLSISLRNAAFLPLARAKRSLVMMLVVAALVVSLTLTLVTFGSIIDSMVIGSGGTVNLPVDVGFYWDSNCANPVSLVDWGTIEPGSTVDVTVFVRNEGSQTISLDITAENWSPIETTSYMTFSSNCIGQPISPQEILQITLSLSTSPNIEEITSFSFDISVNINPA